MSDTQKASAAVGIVVMAVTWTWRRIVGVIDGKATRAELELLQGSLSRVHLKLDSISESVGSHGERIARLEGASE